MMKFIRNPNFQHTLNPARNLICETSIGTEHLFPIHVSPHILNRRPPQNFLYQLVHRACRVRVKFIGSSVGQ